MFAKSDLDRLGYFKEQSYHTIGDPYVDSGKFEFNSNAVKGRQVYGQASKSMSALNEGYFTNYQRAFMGECITDMGKVKRQERMRSKARQNGPIFYPPAGPKQLIGCGGYWGTFSGPIESFDARQFTTTAKPVGRSIYTNPPKKGAGLCYPNVTIGRYPAYQSEPYVDVGGVRSASGPQQGLQTSRRQFVAAGHIDLFGPDPYKLGVASGTTPMKSHPTKFHPSVPFIPPNPAKLDGGSKAGTLSRFPIHLSDPYVDPFKIHRPTREQRIFVPASGCKSTRSESILSRNVKKAINRSNYGSVNSVIYVESCAS